MTNLFFYLSEIGVDDLYNMESLSTRMSFETRHPVSQSALLISHNR